MAISGKVLALLLAGTFGASALTYTGSVNRDLAKQDFTELQSRIILTADEAKTKIDLANTRIANQNKKYTDLVAQSTPLSFTYTQNNTDRLSITIKNDNNIDITVSYVNRTSPGAPIPPVTVPKNGGTVAVSRSKSGSGSNAYTPIYTFTYQLNNKTITIDM